MFAGQVAAAVNELRQSYDLRSAQAIAAHLTLAGPCDTNASVRAVEARLAETVSECAPLAVTIAGAGTFLPVSPTAFLQVEPRAELMHLHDRLIGRLGWSEPYPYCPHVTICEYLPAPATGRAVAELRALLFRESVTVDSASLLERGPEGRWVVLNDFPFGSAVAKHPGTPRWSM